MVGAASALASALDFDAEDLALNRAGQISPRQRQQLRNWGARARRRALIFFVVGILAASLAIFWGIRQDAAALTWLGIVIILINAAATGLAGRYQLRLRADSDGDASVLTLEGEVSRVIQPIGRLRLRYLRVAGRDFPIHARAFATFQSGETYRIHYCRQTGYLLTAEALNPD